MNLRKEGIKFKCLLEKSPELMRNNSSFKQISQQVRQIAVQELMQMFKIIIYE
jgi:hypothetical protein